MERGGDHRARAGEGKEMRMRKFRFCSDCGEPITKGSKSGKCRRCGHMKGNIKQIKKHSKPRSCSECPREISQRSTTGKCKWCRDKEIRTRKTASLNSKGTKDAICYRCKKPYKANKNQHPKYSYCPSCKAFSTAMSPALLWSGGGNI